MSENLCSPATLTDRSLQARRVRKKNLLGSLQFIAGPMNFDYMFIRSSMMNDEQIIFFFFRVHDKSDLLTKF
jgi:hypothetical protein